MADHEISFTRVVMIGFQLASRELFLRADAIPIALAISNRSTDARYFPTTTLVHIMSSTPMTPGTRSGSHDDDSPPLSSPASSPPPMPESDNERIEDADYDPKAEAMHREEERLAKDTQKKQKKGALSKKAGQDPGADAKNYEKLEWFMSQSKVRLPINTN